MRSFIPFLNQTHVGGLSIALAAGVSVQLPAGTGNARVDPSWKKGRPRRCDRQIWYLCALSLLPLPPTIVLLALAVHRHERFCVTARIADALALICVVATLYLFVRLAMIARAAAARRLLISADDLALVGMAVAIGAGTYLSIAKGLSTRGCL